MIVKPIEPPFQLKQTEALSRRLHSHHFKKVDVDESARRLRAGYNGEKSLGFHLSLLQDHAFHILHNIRLPDENDFFQIDNLINSLQLILINEVKNIFRHSHL
ncbi:nuclease-related domain-containing protein [Virgibacillus siamensis]|uniref:nuclease-related domain-containing protein n=1 Tax=Virgibacillus siamensis TaxID=480071 RepID=UPI00158AC3C6|nr:nuclease-related domain-containing protein [Virgibacillus siamensis]